MKSMVLAVVAASFLSGCATDSHQNKSMASESPTVDSARILTGELTATLFPDTLSGAAWHTYTAYVRAVNAGEISSQSSIPEVYWSDKIKALKPIRVYSHRANLVVVQNVSDQIEAGKYIYIPISSYLPMSGDDGFVFTPDPRNGDEYTLPDSLDFERTLTE